MAFPCWHGGTPLRFVLSLGRTTPSGRVDQMTACIGRREFVTLLGGAAAWPLAARAQQPAKAYRIAIVHPSVPIADMSKAGGNPYYPALFKELRRLGYVEGKN